MATTTIDVKRDTSTIATSQTDKVLSAIAEANFSKVIGETW